MATGEIPLSLWERSTRKARRVRVSKFDETCTLTRAPSARALSLWERVLHQNSSRSAN